MKGDIFMLWDTHMHTHFSGDSNADPAAMARSAIEKNLAGICITDHLDYDYPDEPDLFTIDFPQYEKGIRQLQADFSDSLNINFGIELGLQPHLAKKHHEILQEMDFDFVIGSSPSLQLVLKLFLCLFLAKHNKIYSFLIALLQNRNRKVYSLSKSRLLYTLGYQQGTFDSDESLCVVLPHYLQQIVKQLQVKILVFLLKNIFLYTTIPIRKMPKQE